MPPIVLAVSKAVAVSALPVRAPVTLAVIELVTLIVSTYTYAHLFVLDPKFQVELAAGIIDLASVVELVKLPPRLPVTCVIVAESPVKLSEYVYAYLCVFDPKFQVESAEGNTFFVVELVLVKLPPRLPVI